MTDSPLDLQALDMLREVMEDDFDLLIDTFIDDAAARLDRLSQQYAAMDIDDIRREAHSLKGSSGNIGAAGFSQLCFVLEDQCRNGNSEGIEQRINAICSEFEIVKQALRQL